MSDAAVNQTNTTSTDSPADDVLASIRKLVAQNAAASEKRALVLTADHRVSESPISTAPRTSVVKSERPVAVVPDAPVVKVPSPVSAAPAPTPAKDVTVGSADPQNVVPVSLNIPARKPLLDPSRTNVPGPQEPVFHRADPAADSAPAPVSDTPPSFVVKPAAETSIPVMPPMTSAVVQDAADHTIPTAPSPLKSLSTNIEEAALEAAQTKVLEESISSVAAQMDEDGDWAPDNAYAPIDDDTYSDDSLLSDADRLEIRELVTDIIREELRGELGEKITRNVRKLVRREIQKALSASDLG